MHGFIQIVKPNDNMPNVPVGAILGPAYLMQENNAALDRIDSVWLVNNHGDSDSYWTEYKSYNA